MSNLHMVNQLNFLKQYLVFFLIYRNAKKTHAIKKRWKFFFLCLKRKDSSIFKSSDCKKKAAEKAAVSVSLVQVVLCFSFRVVTGRTLLY